MNYAPSFKKSIKDTKDMRFRLYILGKIIGLMFYKNGWVIYRQL